jgi:NAD-dependent SIR2 family protein deacetylase
MSALLTCSECNDEYPEADAPVVDDEYPVCPDCREIMLAFIATICGPLGAIA